MQTSQVFVSHTSDMARFPQGRSFVQAALDAVVRARLMPVDMRYFAARDGEPAGYCRTQVSECEIYVAVVGFRYGSVVPGEAVSYTELEFQAATASGLPRLVFLLEETVSVPEGWADADRGPVEGFRQRLSAAGLIVRSFTSAADLELEVFHALAKLTGTGHLSEMRRPAADPALAVVDGELRRDGTDAHAGGSPLVALSQAAGGDGGSRGYRREIAGYLQRLIGWFSTDPWPRDRRFDGPVLTPAAIERRLRVLMPGPTDDEYLEADDLARQCRRLVVLGGPGSGKTWLARRAARQCADEALEALTAGADLDEVELPLYTTCSLLFRASGSIREAAVSSALDQLGDLGGPRVNADLRAYIAGRRAPLLLVIDSLDEAHGSRERLRQADTLPWRIILTTRPSSWNQQLAIDDTDDSHRVGELQPLRYPEDVEPFIHAWFAYQPGRAEDLAAQIAQRPGFQQAATVPLVLAFYCIVGGHELLPESRRDLYGKVLGRLLTGRWRGDEDQHPDISICLRALRTWAWPGPEACHPVSGIGTWTDDITTPSAGLGDADQNAVDHVAMPLGPADIDTGQTPRRFIHRTIREHLVAEFAARLPVGQAAEALLPHLWYDPDWEYSAPAAVAMHPQRSQLLRDLICRASGSAQIPEDLSVIDAGWEFRSFLARIVPESSETDWTPEIAEVISRARVDLALSGRVETLDGSELWPDSDSKLRNALIGLLADPANGWAAGKLVDAVVRLATTAEDKRQARDALLELLPGHSSGFEAARFVSNVIRGAVQLAATAAGKRTARTAMLRLLAGQADSWLAGELASGISQLSPTERQKHLAREALLALVPGQDDDGQVIWLVNRAAHLAATDQDKRETRDRILRLLDGRVPGWAASEIVAIATRLMPAADNSHACDMLQCQGGQGETGTPASGIAWRGRETEDDGHACGQLLEALASEIDGRSAAGIAAAVACARPTAPEKQQALAILLKLLSSQTDSRTAAELAGVMSRLSPSAEDSDQIRKWLLSLLHTQILAGTVTWLADAIIQAGPSPREEQLLRNALLRLLATQSHGLQITRLAYRISRLNPSAKDKRQTREALLRSMASQADGRMALKLAGCLRELNPMAADRHQAREILLGLLDDHTDGQLTRDLTGMLVQLAVTAQHRRQAREVLLGLLDDHTDGQLARDLAGMLVQLAAAGEDRRQARDVLLCLLGEQVGSPLAPELLGWLVQLAGSSKDRHDTGKALLRLLPTRTSPRQTAELVAAVVQLATTPDSKRRARRTFLSVLTQADGWTAIELTAGLIQLSPGPRDKNRARKTILALLAGPTSGPLAARLMDGLTQLDPAARDIRTWQARDIPLTAELLAMVRRNSELTEWLAAIPILAPPPQCGS